MNSLRRPFAVGLLTLVWCVVGALVSLPPVQASDPPVTTGRWQNYTSATPDFPDEAPIVATLVDFRHRLWVGTEGAGVAMFDGFKWTRYTNANTGGQLLSDTVWFLAELPQGVWIGGPNGISVYDLVDNVWDHLTPANGLPSEYVNDVVAGVFENQDLFYFGTADKGVVICEIDIFDLTIIGCPQSETQGNSKLHSDAVFDMVGNSEHRWMITGAGVVRVVDPFGIGEPEVRTFYDFGTPNCPNISFANNVKMDLAHQRVWFTLSSRYFAAGDPGPGYGACVFDLQTETWREFHTGNSGLGDNSVLDVAIDSEGRAWFGALGDNPGVYVYTWITDACCWKTYKTDTPGSQLLANPVRTVEASLDRVWFAHPSSLSSFSLHWQRIAVQNGVSAVAYLPGQILLGTGFGLQSFDGTTRTTLRQIGFLFDILALSPDEIWISSVFNAVHHWDGTTWTQFNTSNSGLVNNFVNALAKDNLGRIWMGTSAGLSVYEKSSNSWATFTTATTPNTIPSDVIRGIETTEAGDVWIATNGGVSHFDGSNWRTFTTANGLPSNTVSSIAIDTEGRIWAGTTLGPARYTPLPFNTNWFNNLGFWPRNDVQDIHAPATGGVWIGASGATFFYDPSLDRFLRYRAANSGLDHELIGSITSDATGGIWFGGGNYSPGNVIGDLWVRSVDPEPLGDAGPTITSFTPVSATAGMSITIIGTGFQPGGKVFFSANGPNTGHLAEVISQTGTVIVTRLPSQAVRGKLRVTNSVGAAESADEFLPIPVITAIDPATGPIGLPIKIIGTNLASTGFSEAKFGGGAYNSLIISTTKHNLIEAVVPKDASNGAVMVKTASGEATGPNFTLSGGGLKLLDWEVHQGLPEYQDLVAGKSTVVRLFLGSDAPSGCAYVSGALLQILGPGGTHVRYAQVLTNGGIPNGGWFCGTTKQVAAGGSIDFLVPGESFPKGKHNLAVSFSSRFITLFDKVLGDYIFTPTDDLRVHIAAPGWEHWSDPNVYGPMTEAQTGLFSFNRQLVNFNRIYPVRDGMGGIFTENGLRWILNPNFTLCNGVDDGFCSNASNSYNFLYDFWQENINGVLRMCMVATRFPANTTDDGSVMSFKHSFKPNDLKRMDFIVMVRPGVALPADLNSLVTFNTGSPELVVETREIVKSFQGPAGCPMLNYTDMFMFRTRVRNTGSNTFTNHIITADYNEGVVNSAANGGVVLGTGASPQTYVVPGQFLMPDGQQGEGFDMPMDMNYDGILNNDDFVLFLKELDDWNPGTGEFATTTDFSLLSPKDVMRNFVDHNGNQLADPSDSWAPYLERHRDQYVRYAIYDVPRNYRNAFNATSPVDAQFSQLWLWDRANPHDIMGLGGQAPGHEMMWADMADHTAIVHETGHNVGLPHSEESGIPGLPFGNIPNIPYGYNIVERRVVIGRDLKSSMAGAVVSPIENAFFNPLQYHHVFNVFWNQSDDGAVRAASANQGPVIHLAGLIGQNGQVSVTTSYRSDALAVTPLDVAGNYWLKLVGATDLLEEYRFGVEFEVKDLAEGETAPVLAPFEVTQPWVDGTKFVEIWQGTKRIYQLAVSAATPTVTVLSPNGGESVAADGTLTVQWSGSDADGDTLTYRVYYSADGGTTWGTLAAGTSANQVVVPAATLPGSANALVEVHVSDGVNVASDRSNASFTVAGKGPVGVSIVSPNPGEQLVQSHLQTLVGSAYDLEDGQLAGSRLAWHSSQLGALGTGDILTVSLPVSVHVLTLVATDSANLTKSVSITVEVLADFDKDGLADSFEEQYGELAWWNPDDAGADPDVDGLTSRSEAAWGTDPGNADSDGDGANDGDEAAAGSLPNDPNSKPEAARVLASAGELSFAMAEGGANPPATELLIMSSTPTDIAWTASVNGSWLKLDVASGQTPAQVMVSVQGNALPAGVYQGQITFQGGATPWVIPVSFTVASESPQVHLRIPFVER